MHVCMDVSGIHVRVPHSFRTLPAPLIPITPILAPWLKAMLTSRKINDRLGKRLDKSVRLHTILLGTSVLMASLADEAVASALALAAIVEAMVWFTRLAF
jgi:hypothetical protein